MIPVNEHPTPKAEYPFYIKTPAILLGLVLFVYILGALGDILVPLAFAVLISILLNPLYNRLQKRIPKVPSILLTILLAIVLVVALIYFLSTQIATFASSIPLLKQKINSLATEAQKWSVSHFSISIQKQLQAFTNSLSNGSSFITNTLGTVLSTLSVVVLIPVYIFLILFYKPLILDFLFQIFQEKHSLQVAEILDQTKGAVQSFMIGLMIETTIVCVMNSVACMIIGVPSAIVIGVIGGILNLLPYIGGVVAYALPILMLTITRDGFTAQLWVIVAYTIIQFIDNNFLVPRIVSKKVQINALMSIVVVLLGGALWGVSGMFLSIPLIGVLKIIFDRVEGLKPWGRLLGDEIPTEHTGVIWQKRWDRILRKIQKKKEMELAVDQQKPA